MNLVGLFIELVTMHGTDNDKCKISMYNVCGYPEVHGRSRNVEKYSIRREYNI